MTIRPIARPGSGENAPYYDQYISRVPDGNVLAQLVDQNRRLVAALRGLTEERALFRYAPGKWSVKEVLGHLADAERVFAGRALWVARGDQTPLPGFDENAWVPVAGFDARPLSRLLDEYAAVRAATVSLFAGLDESALVRVGIANGSPISVRALGWILAGHEIHHTAILNERYGVEVE